MTLNLKTIAIIVGVVIVLISASYLKGCYDERERINAQLIERINSAKPDTSTSQITPDLPKPQVIYLKGKPVKDTSWVAQFDSLKAVITDKDSLIAVLAQPQGIAFVDSLEKNLADEGESPLPFYLRISHSIVFYPSGYPTQIETNWDSLSVPVRTITKTVLKPVGFFNMIEFVLMGTGIGIILTILINGVF